MQSAGAPADPAAGPPRPAWQQALAAARLPLGDVHWTPAVVIDRPGRNSGGFRVGLSDGRVLALHTLRASIARRLQLYDVVFVRVADAKGKAPYADLRVRPVVQGAALVLDNKTGRILAMAGGFSYGLSQLNRTAQTRRQPGSAIKPLTYLAALQAGLQPNTMIRDQEITLAPINGSNRDRDYWSPRNYDGSAWGVVTLRRALENSRNLATVGLLDDGSIAATPEMSLDKICGLAQEAQLYAECQHYYPVVLGAQPVRMIDLAAFYAAIANEGARPTPHAIASVEQDGRTVWRDDTKPAIWLGSADRVAFYQLKSMLQGVVQRGTAASIRQLGPYVAGKTGTSEDENDAWFVGLTNDVTVAVWLGYDNKDARRTLGSGATGGHVAVPIFKSIIEAVWADYAPQTPLAPPSQEAQRQIVMLPVDPRTGNRVPARSPGAINEPFRVDASGRIDDTQYRIVSADEVETSSLYGRDDQAIDQPPVYPSYGYGNPYSGGQYGGPQVYPRYPQQPGYPPYRRGLFGSWTNEEPERPPQQRDRRVDPDYFFWHRMD
jgi:membrane carboxypeptidase/penicillin-binding protein